MSAKIHVQLHCSRKEDLPHQNLKCVKTLEFETDPNVVSHALTIKKYRRVSTYKTFHNMTIWSTTLQSLGPQTVQERNRSIYLFLKTFKRISFLIHHPIKPGTCCCYDMGSQFFTMHIKISSCFSPRPCSSVIWFLSVRLLSNQSSPQSQRHRQGTKFPERPMAGII